MGERGYQVGTKAKYEIDMDNGERDEEVGATWEYLRKERPVIILLYLQVNEISRAKEPRLCDRMMHEVGEGNRTWTCEECMRVPDE